MFTPNTPPPPPSTELKKKARSRVQLDPTLKSLLGAKTPDDAKETLWRLMKDGRVFTRADYFKVVNQGPSSIELESDKRDQYSLDHLVDATASLTLKVKRKVPKVPKKETGTKPMRVLGGKQILRGSIPVPYAPPQATKPKRDRMLKDLDAYGDREINKASYKKALYRLKEERTEKPTRAQRESLRKDARRVKGLLFDRLTGVTAQAGIGLNHGLSEATLSQIKDITSNMNVSVSLNETVTEAIKDMTRNFRSMFESTNMTVGGAAGVLHDTMANLTSITNNGLQTIDSALNGITTMLWVVPLLCAAYYACTHIKEFMTTSAFAAVSLALSTILPVGLWDMVKDYWPSEYKCTTDDQSTSTSYESFEDDIEEQAGMFETKSLAHIIAASLTYMSIGKKDTLGIMKGLVDKMPNYSRSVDSWEKLSTYILEALEIFINFVRRQFGADNISLLKTGIQAVDSWCTRVMTVLNDSHTGGDIMNPDSVHLLCALRDEGASLTNMYRFAKDVSPILHRYLGMLDELCRVCSAAMHSFKGGRPQPVVMALTGKPGVGKTYLCKVITSLVLKGIITADHAKRLNYNFDSEVFMKGTTEYWNGYSGQKAVVVDDWGQTVPVAGGENDFIDLIRMANCWSYPLNFADVDNKGKNFFKSSFLLLTTNATNIDYCQRVILEPDAVTRRIDHGYEIEISPDYQRSNGTLNFEKITKEIQETKQFPYHAWVLYKYKFAIGSASGRTSSTPISLRDAVEIASNNIVRNQNMHEDNTQMVSSMLRDFYCSDKQAQGGVFEDFLKGATKVYNNISIPTLRYQVEALQSFGLTVKDYCRAIVEEVTSWSLRTVLSVLVGLTSTVLIFGALKMAIQTIFSWFRTKTKEGFSKVRNALRKKVSIPDPVLAQAINALKKEDFQVAELQQDGTYDLCLKFTPDVLKRAYERLTNSSIQSNEPQNYKLKYAQVKGTRVFESDVEMQGDIYGNSMSDTSARNLYSFKLLGVKGMQRLGHVLMVRGSLGIFPEHFLDSIDRALEEDVTPDDFVVLQNLKDHTYKIEIPIRSFLKFKKAICKDRDCVMVNFESLRAARDISDFFVTQKDVSNLNNIRLRLDSMDGREQIVHRTRFVVANRSERLEYAGVNGTKRIFDNYEYKAFTTVGDCGSVATLQDHPSFGCRRILGIHVAGSPSSGLGFTTIIYAELLKGMLDQFDVPREIFPQAGDHNTFADPVCEGSFIGLNLSDRTYNMNPTSSLIKTKLYGMWGNLDKKPAPLAPFINKETLELVKPMAKAVEGYASPVLHFDTERVAEAAYHAFAPLRKLTREHSRRIVPFEEAVAGVPDTNINGIPRGTSPGFPYVLDGITSKKPFFGGADEYEFDRPIAAAVKERVENILDEARSNVRLPHIYVDFLKDELRPIAKAKAGQSRLISAAPMDYVIAFRMMFLSFTSAVQSTRVQNGVGVGINHYTEWDMLARKLKSKGPHCVAGDFKGFDKEEQPAIHWAILDQINEWYDDGPENARIRRVLWLEVVHSRHFGGLDGRADRFYQWNKSLSSGHPATSIINSFYGLVLFVLVWVDSVGPLSASTFWDYVYVCTYGDDNVLNIATEKTDVFNQDTIALGMKRYGMSYTNENKDGEVAPTRSLKEISFLKRGFRYEQRLSRWVGPLDLNSVLYTAYWARSKMGIEQNVADNLEFSWTELALHEPLVWDEYAPILRRKFLEIMRGEPKHVFMREKYQDIALSMVPVWEK